ncbi:hypothetical protein CBR_g39639 [Chara braunii]|uniref:Uncharacterized protein n=1 Tax=Chara braunii TaxID=69332 RepID=A0A388K1F4_CHABU|nr:hypothetical protein CBR_g39639 [Chara braunii]|eukprot:GBG63855.1 hypothetical protein CBR_g39639 [Chara braunii]
MSPVVAACHVGRAGTVTWQPETLLSVGQANGTAARAGADGPFHPPPRPLGLSSGYHCPLLDERVRRGEVHVARREHIDDGRRVRRLRAVITRVTASGSGSEAPMTGDDRSVSRISARCAELADEAVVRHDEGSQTAHVSPRSCMVTRRQTGLGIAAVAVAASMEMAAVGSAFEPASAVEQLMLAGRIPGLSDPDESESEKHFVLS